MSITSTYCLLKKEQPDRNKVRKKFARKPNHVLLGAIANPEHSESARAILLEMADQRGIEREEVRGWVLTEESMFVAPFGSQPSIEEALALPKRRRVIYRSLQLVMVVSWFLAWFTFASWESLAVGALIGGVLIWYLGSIYSWLSPSRILLLRPFQSKKLSRSLLRFVRKNLAFHGHVMTLSDKHLKESRLLFLAMMIPRSPWELLLIPVFFIPYLRQFQRWLYVGSAGSYRLLKSRLARRFTLNNFWVQSFNKLTKVRCSDVWWKQAVDLLMFSSQLIVVDLSLVKEGTEWELDKIDERDLERKTVFIVAEESAEYASKVIAKFWHQEAPPPLFVYNNRGKLLEQEGYELAVAGIISQSHLWDGATAQAR